VRREKGIAMKANLNFWRKTVAYATLASFVLAQVTQVAQAASTDISDVPMAVKNLSPANIMFMLDNSGSMSNIVVDAPYVAPSGITCGTPAIVITGGAAAPNLPNNTDTFDLHVASGVQKINRQGGTGTPQPATGSNADWGTTKGTYCFDPALRYNARLNGDINCGSDACPSGYLDAVYPGDFLNWYFSNGGANFGVGARRKPGTTTRLEITKSASKAVLDSFINNTANKVRVGLSTYNGQDGGQLLEIMNDVTTNVASMKTKIDALTSSSSTPIAETLSDIGRYFATGVPATGIALPFVAPVTPPVAPVLTTVQAVFETGSGRSSFFANNSGQAIAAPIQNWCQRSFALLMTDGQPQADQSMSTVLRNYKRDCPNPDVAHPTRSATTTVAATRTATTTSGSPTLTAMSTADVTAANIGESVSGAGIPAGATVSAKPTTTSLTLSLNGTTTPTIPANATASATGVSLSFGSTVLTGMTAANVTATNIGDYVSGTGIPSLAKVVAKPTTTSLTLSANATVAGTNTLTFSASQCIAGTPGGSPDNFGRKAGRFYESQGSDYLDDVAKALFDAELRPDLQPPTTTPPTVKNKPNNVITYVIGFAEVQLLEDAGLVQDTANSGGGLFIAANNSTELVAAFEKAADDILSKDGSSAAVAVANANVIAGDNASYASSYNSGTWTGDLIAYPLNVGTGDADIQNPIWMTGCARPDDMVDSSDTSLGKKGCSAQVQLDTRLPSTRLIFSYTGTTGTSQGIQFQPTSASTTTKLSTVQQTLLNSTAATDGAAVLGYVRGDRGGETATYRLRTHVLGDIINSEPLVVREPASNYIDSGYASFKSTYSPPSASARTRIVIQGANDGMVHAFNAATGAEEWAYVPNLLLGSLNNLSKRTGFSHKFLIDGTPITGDANFKNTDGSSASADDWRTLVIGGFGKGGRGYYALDVTTTTAASEAAVISKALWEFPNSATAATDKVNIGYTFGRPILVKTAAKGWVVLVASGYNNGTNVGNSGGDGQGWLFVLNARTGDVIKAIPTGVGSITDPSGLAHISAYVESTDIDNTTTAVYGGDLKGNVWRFDLSDASIVNWNVKKIATLVDASSTPQPITTEPELAKVDIGTGNFKRFIYVGTGEYLGDSDVPGVAGVSSTGSTQTQTMYGLIDDLSSTPTINPTVSTLRTNLQQQTLTNNAGGLTRDVTSNAVDFGTKKGWYLDMPAAGERINTHPALALGALVFTSNIPSGTQCVPGGSSFFTVLDYKNGGHLIGSTWAYSSTSLGNALASRVVLIKLPSGAVKAIARKSDATTVTTTVPLPPSTTTLRRRSWREVPQ
jgi:Tfp pilus tip-associated adhesin PilY1